MPRTYGRPRGCMEREKIEGQQERGFWGWQRERCPAAAMLGAWVGGTCLRVSLRRVHSLALSPAAAPGALLAPLAQVEPG